jgi:hypothetical protein
MPATLYVTFTGDDTNLPTIQNPTIPPDGVSITAGPGGTTTYQTVGSNAGGTVSTSLTYNPGTQQWSAAQATYTTAADGTITESPTSLGVQVTTTKQNSYSLSMTFAPGATTPSSIAGGIATPATSSTMTVSWQDPTFSFLNNSGTVGNLTQATGQGGTAVNVTSMPVADRQVFLDELNVLYAEVAANPTIDVTQVATAAQAIMLRYTQAAFYYNQAESTLTPITSALSDGALATGASSTDGNGSVVAACVVFTGVGCSALHEGSQGLVDRGVERNIVLQNVGRGLEQIAFSADMASRRLGETPAARRQGLPAEAGRGRCFRVASAPADVRRGTGGAESRPKAGRSAERSAALRALSGDGLRPRSANA